MRQNKLPIKSLQIDHFSYGHLTKAHARLALAIGVGEHFRVQVHEKRRIFFGFYEKKERAKKWHRQG